MAFVGLEWSPDYQDFQRVSEGCRLLASFVSAFLKVRGFFRAFYIMFLDLNGIRYLSREKLVDPNVIVTPIQTVDIYLGSTTRL